MPAGITEGDVPEYSSEIRTYKDIIDFMDASLRYIGELDGVKIMMVGEDAL